MPFEFTIPARRSLNISNRLNESGSGYIDLKEMYEGNSQNRQDRAEFFGIYVIGPLDGDGDSSIVQVNCTLWDDNIGNVIPFWLVSMFPYMLSIRRIYQEGTTPGSTIIMLG